MPATGMVIGGSLVSAYTQSGTLTPGWLPGIVIGSGALVGGALGMAGSGLLSRRERARAVTAARADVLELFPVRLPHEVAEDGRPSTLLRPERAQAPFRGRQKELSTLLSWSLAGSERLCLLWGPPLVGKTRLAMELAEHLPDVWTVGRLRLGTEGGAVARLRACPGPHLVVVEIRGRGEGWAEFLNDLALAPDTRVRGLVICRSLTWLRALRIDLAESTVDVLDAAPRVYLEAEGGEGDQARWYSEAVCAFAAKLGRPVPRSVVRGPSVGTPIGGVQARALVEVLAGEQALGVTLGSSPNPTAGAEEAAAMPGAHVAGALAEHEVRLWPQPEGVGPVSDDILRQCVAAAILLCPTDASETVAVVRRVPALSNASEERVRALGRWLHNLYPGPTTGSVTWPSSDLVASGLTLPVLQGEPDFRRGVLSDLTPIVVAELIARLMPAVNDFPNVGAIIEEVVCLNKMVSFIPELFTGLIDANASRRVDEVLASLVEHAELDRDQLDELAHALETRVPLHRARIAIQFRVVELARATADPIDLAMTLANLGAICSASGRHAAGLAAAQEAVATYRRLVEADLFAHLPDLAKTLSNLGATCSALGRHASIFRGRDVVA